MRIIRTEYRRAPWHGQFIRVSVSLVFVFPCLTVHLALWCLTAQEPVVVSVATLEVKGEGPRWGPRGMLPCCRTLSFYPRKTSGRCGAPLEVGPAPRSRSGALLLISPPVALRHLRVATSTWLLNCFPPAFSSPVGLLTPRELQILQMCLLKQ